MQRLKISDNKRFLVKEDGSPFFYLGDTAWEIFHRLDEAQAQQYLCNRAGKGFNVIQSVILAEIDGIGTTNPYGHLPLTDRDPEKPNEEYFKHVDYVIDLANSLGLYMAVLPTWASNVWAPQGEGKLIFGDSKSRVIFNEKNARIYGEYLGKRYRDKGLIWILGGDRPGDGVEKVWKAMAEGLKAGDGGSHLISFHPYGGRSSAEWFHDADWLDFNMIQSGHSRKYNANYLMIQQDYRRSPIKPVMDAEPCYEDLPMAFEPKNGRFNDYDCRVAAYWGVFSGGCGHTYGCNNIWQMWEPNRQPLAYAHLSWQDSMNLPGSFQMRHLKNLMESRPYLTRIPDPAIVYDNNNPRNHGSDYQLATRDGSPGKNDATYLMVYRPIINWISVDTACIAGPKLRAWWYDPKTGTAYPSPIFDNPKKKFGGLWHWMPWRLGTDQIDWVLVVDDAEKNYPPPGEGLK
ncbi:MAG: DUF4038 domain-containing protein [Bacillota bacterium]